MQDRMTVQGGDELSGLEPTTEGSGMKENHELDEETEQADRTGIDGRGPAASGFDDRQPAFGGRGFEPPAPTASRPRRGPRRVALVLVGLLVAAALGAGWFLPLRDDAPDQAVPAAQPASEPAAEEPAVVTPVLPAGTEPVAAAAAAVAPAVVQLEAGQGLGSGVIYDPSGLVLTAAHVVQGASTVTVRLADGTAMEGTVLGAHAPSDVAVVQIEGSSGFPTAQLAAGDELQVGQLAVAVGSPFGLDQTVTSGIVSAVDRTVEGVSGTSIFVQTDAAINPGNSGGPLVDAQGRVIGINDAIISQSGGSDGVGFAIAVDLASIVADQITAGEPVQLAFLGVSTAPSASGEAGAVIQEVVGASAAEAAGLETGDRVVSVDGQPVRDSEDLRARIITNEPGTMVTLGVVRDGESITVSATLGATDS